MDDTELHVYLDRLRACIQSRDDDEVEDTLMELESAVLEFEYWPIDFFKGLEALLKDHGFLGLGKSWSAFYFINNNWSQIPEEQKGELHGVFEYAFDKCGDWMGAFVIGEILGEKYPDEITLGILTRLAKTARPPSDELIPHVFEHFAKATGQKPLKKAAVEHLQELRKHESEGVRREACLSLAKLDVK